MCAPDNYNLHKILRWYAAAPVIKCERVKVCLGPVSALVAFRFKGGRYAIRAELSEFAESCNLQMKAVN